MAQLNWLWWLIAGALIGWLASTLIEWLWFRRKRMELRDERIADLEDALSSTARSGSGLPEPIVPPTSVPPLPLPVVPERADSPAAKSRPAAVAESSPPEFVTDHDDAPIEMTPHGEEEMAPSPSRSAPLRPAVDETLAKAPVVAQSSQAAVATVEPETPVTRSAETTKPVPASKAGSDPVRQPNVVDMDANENYPDDLTEITGIGRAYERRLYEAGIYAWNQIAAADVDRLREVTDARQTANVEEWPSQAKSLAEKYGRTHIRYIGPVPDKFSEIAGIGVSNEHRLYRAGIVSYSQLAQLTIAQLEHIIPPSKSGASYDLASWIAQAASLTKT